MDVVKNDTNHKAALILIIFPIVYLLSFLFALRDVLKGNKQGALLFFIFGLSIYTTVQSVSFQLNLRAIIPFLQPLKELLILLVLAHSVMTYRSRSKLHLVDYLVLAYFCYTLLYVILPIGSFSFFERVSAFKSTSFLVFIYAAGRLMKSNEIYISKYFHYILAVAIAACGILLFELVTNTHFQTLTGYANFNFYYFNQEATGNYGLSWTFETENGLKRFASFLANPLEHAAATLLALAVIGGLYTTDNNRLKPDLFGTIAFIATQISVFFALSRASFFSYFTMIYVYGLVTGKKYIIHIFHAVLAFLVVYFIFLIQNKDLYDLVVDTLTFQNASSLGHVLEWITGVQAMLSSPLGLGLGSSGKISGALGSNIGGENSFIIIGVQAGIIAFFIYLALQLSLIIYPFKWIKKLKGKERKIAITLFLIKIGSILPLMTSDFESYSYISYITWFLSGLFVSIISEKSILPLPVYETN